MPATYLDQWANILVLDRTLATQLVEAAPVGPISHRLVLQIALTTLVTDGAVEGMVGEQELHDTLASLVNEGRVGFDDHAGLDGPGARGDGLRSALDFDETHTAVSGNHELLMVAVARDGGAGLFAGLDERGAGCGWQGQRYREQGNGRAGQGSPSIETFLPSGTSISAAHEALGREWDAPMVSSTSALRWEEAAKVRRALAAARRWGSLADRRSCCRSIWWSGEGMGGADLDGGDVEGVVHAGGTRHRIDVFCGLARFLTYPHRRASDWRPGARLQKALRPAHRAPLFFPPQLILRTTLIVGAPGHLLDQNLLCYLSETTTRWAPKLEQARGNPMTTCSLPSTLHFSTQAFAFCG